MLDYPEPIDFTPLIKALQAANEALTFAEQVATIELALVSAELHPQADNFCSFLWSLELLQNIDITARRWKPAPESVSSFFTA